MFVSCCRGLESGAVAGAGARSWVPPLLGQSAHLVGARPGASWLWSLRTSAISSSQRERGSGTYLRG